MECHKDSTLPEQETLSFEDIYLQPELLIGRRIKHRFQVDGELVWYVGVVQQLNFVTNEFQVAVPPTSRIRPYFYENLVRITGKNLRIRKRNSAPGGVASITTNGEHARSTDYVR